MILRILGLMAALSIGLELPAAAELRIRVMSFNVRYGTADDGDNSWSQRKEIVAELIRKYSPDLIGTQECLDFQAEYLVSALPEYAWFGVGRESDGGGEHVAILYKKDTFMALETGKFWLSKTPDAPGSKDWGSHSVRMVTWGRFQHRASKQVFHFFNTHLDNGSEEARREGTRLLLSRIHAVAGPVLVTGDFNTEAEITEPWRILTSTDLADAWLSAGRRIGPETTWGAFRPPPPESGKARIDWILTRGAWTVDSCETVLFNHEGRYPSDHYPVIATVILKDRPG